MTAIKTTLTLSEKDQEWMGALIHQGEYLNKSEYVRDLIRRDKEVRLSAEYQYARQRLREAEARGVSIRTPRDIVEETKERLKNGEI